MTSIGEPLPWSDQVRAKDSDERRRFLESHVDLVRYLALRISTRLPASVELDDLVHDGILGLLDAVDKYDASRNVRFRTYAEARVRGAILDGLRRKDWRPRSLRNLQRRVDQATGELSSTHRRAATEEEIADRMGVDLETYRARLADIGAGPMLSLEELPAGVDSAASDETEGPQASIERRELIESLALEIEALPERERRVIELYYHEGLNMKEVGAVLGVTESRVCQLHGQAASRLRVGLRRRLHAEPVGTPPAGSGGTR